MGRNTIFLKGEGHGYVICNHGNFVTIVTCNHGGVRLISGNHLGRYSQLLRGGAVGEGGGGRGGGGVGWGRSGGRSIVLRRDNFEH